MKTVRLAALLATTFFLSTASATQVHGDGVTPDDDPTTLSEFTQSQVDAYIARGDQLASEGRFNSARHEYQAAVEIIRAEGKLPALALRRVANSLYYQKRYQSTGKVLLELADEAAEFGDVAVQVWATADAAWVAAAAGDKIDAERRLAKLEKLLTSPYLPDEVRAEVVRTRLATIENATSVAAGASIP